MACLLASAGAAQSWATRDLCFSPSYRIDPSVLSADALQTLRTDAAKIPNGLGNLWRITSPDGAVSHLWGTMHSSEPRLVKLPENVEATLRASDVVAVEYDGVFDSRQAIQAMYNWDDIINFEGDTLQRMNLAEHHHDWIDERSLGLGLELGQADWLTPTGILYMLVSHPCEDFTINVLPVQDGFIHTLAALEGARVVGLETLEDRRSKLDDPENFSLATDIIKLFVETTLDPAQTEADLATYAALYLQGENAAMMEFQRWHLQVAFGTEEGERLRASVDDYLLRERNVNFVSKIVPALAEGNVFIAVGSWHVPGKTGLVALLQKEGYSVVRVPLDRELRSQ